ncbi:MAG: hypothetical protein ACTHON_01295, partial [Humibacter sp.]
VSIENEKAALATEAQVELLRAEVATMRVQLQEVHAVLTAGALAPTDVPRPNGAGVQGQTVAVPVDMQRVTG